MRLNEVFVRHQCQARVIADQPGEAGAYIVGLDKGATFPTANRAAAKRMIFQINSTGTLSTVDGSLGVTTSPIAQVVKCAVPYAAPTANGNVTVTITSALYATPLLITIPVTTTGGDAITQITAALQGNFALTRHFIITADAPGMNSAIHFTVKCAGPNDATLNVNLQGGATGITSVPASTAETAGAGGVVAINQPGSWNLNTPFDILYAEFRNTGTAPVTITGGPQIVLGPGSYFVGAADVAANAVIDFAGQAGAVLEMIIFGWQH